jgi:hypothetical protein
MPTKARKEIETINEKAKRLKLIKDQKSLLEKEEGELKDFFESMGKTEINTGSFLVMVQPQRRETVSLETLKPVFGEKLDPYINVALFNKVTVKAKK